VGRSTYCLLLVASRAELASSSTAMFAMVSVCRLLTLLSAAVVSVATTDGVVAGIAPPPPPTVQCDPKAHPAETCPGGKPCPQCGKAACPCPPYTPPPSNPCSDPALKCCNPMHKPPQKCPGDLVCPNCGLDDCLCPHYVPPPPTPPIPPPKTPADLGAACEACTDVAWNNTNLLGVMGNGCDLNSSAVHVGTRVKGNTDVCCTACSKTKGCTGYTWDSNGGGFCYLKHVSKCKAQKPDQVGQFTASATLRSVPPGAPAAFKPGQCKY